MNIKSYNEYMLRLTTCFLFNYAGRVAVRIQPFRKSFRLLIRGAYIDFDTQLCYYIKGHTQKYTFNELKYAIRLFNLTIKIIMDCFDDTFKMEDFSPMAMVKDFDLDLMDSIIQ